MIDSYERRIFLAMVGRDQRCVAAGHSHLEFGRNSWERFLDHRRFAANHLPINCRRCGHTCSGPFMEMHDCSTSEES